MVVMSTPPNVVFVVVDTVRKDHVSCYGYERETTPNFDAFAEEATLFTDPVSQGPWSVPSHASMFTGKHPSEHGATTIRPILDAKAPLAKRLSGAGYDTYAVSPNYYVRPETGFSRGFDEFHTLSRVTLPGRAVAGYRPLVHALTASRMRGPLERLFNARRVREPPVTGFEGHRDDGLVGAVESVLARADPPYFLFVNLFDCHLPRTPARRYAESFVDAELHELKLVANERAHMIGDRKLGEAERRKMRQLYDAELRTTDERLGALLSLFEEDALVVVVSDHGEHLGEFDLLGHQFSVFEPTVSVPLAVRFPDGGPETVDAQVETRRIFHTILDETGVGSFPERSLRSGVGDEVARGQFVSPMVDIGRFLWDREFAYDSSFLGEALSFERRPGGKRIRFGDDEWVFGYPEWGEGAAVPLSATTRASPGALRSAKSRP